MFLNDIAAISGVTEHIEKPRRGRDSHNMLSYLIHNKDVESTNMTQKKLSQSRNKIIKRDFRRKSGEVAKGRAKKSG